MIRAWRKRVARWRERMLLRELNVYIAAYLLAAGRGDLEKASLFRSNCDRCLFRLRRLAGVPDSGVREE